MRELGRRDYRQTVVQMREFTAARTGLTRDEIWLVEHQPVYTLGQAGRREHLRATGDIAIERAERGGQVTYHGPGQAIAYLLLDLRRRRLGVRDLVCRIEQAVIDQLAAVSIAAQRRAGAPGVYVKAGGAKIAALGLKISHGCTYHGVALNVAMDLAPFSQIDPCGIAGLQVTDMATCSAGARHYDPAAIGRELAGRLSAMLVPPTPPR